MKIFVLFDREVHVVAGYFLFKEISKLPYTIGREICVPVPRYTVSRQSKKDSRYDKLDYRYENGAIVLSVPENVRVFDYCIISFDRDRDTAIENARSKMYG